MKNFSIAIISKQRKILATKNPCANAKEETKRGMKNEKICINKNK